MLCPHRIFEVWSLDIASTAEGERVPPSLRRILGHAELNLRLLTPEGSLAERALDVPVEWVHSSDLPDPTPFLASGQVLLTTGTQFASDADAEFYERYVARLCGLGISALGFGTEVIRDGTPEELVVAALAHDLPMFEVPYGTPFIAIARLTADLVAEETHARDAWALHAQGEISLAALRPDGLNATLSELSAQLDQWVALFDAAGNLDRVYPPDALEGETLNAVTVEASRLLRRRKRASSAIVSEGVTLSLQTLGRRDKLRGVLALGGSAALDRAGQGVVTSVIALAGLSLEQNHALERARRHLRAGVLQAMLGGGLVVAEEISREMWGALPQAPVHVAVADPGDENLDAITDYLEIRVDEQADRVFYAVREGRLILLCSSPAGGSDVLDELCRAFGLHAGRSDPTSYASLPRALSQAEQALERAREGSSGVVEFDSIAKEGVLAFLTRTNAHEIGRTTLEPLTTHDAEEGTALLSTVRVWLEHNGQLDSAARELGVHRHTVRSRIQHAERLLGRDLSTFHARADVWAAILVVG